MKKVFVFPSINNKKDDIYLLIRSLITKYENNWKFHIVESETEKEFLESIYNINLFPTFIFTNENNKEINRFEGKILSPEILERYLRIS